MIKRVGAEASFVAFDLMRLNGANLRSSPHTRAVTYT